MHDRDSCAKLNSFKMQTLSQGLSVKSETVVQTQREPVMQRHFEHFRCDFIAVKGDTSPRHASILYF